MMETLAEETWDVVIAGTSLVQALLALSLSRSDLKILHVDENSYYGGVDAGLSLDEAEAWAGRHEHAFGSFSSARTSPSTSSDSRLASSRSYTLSLNPQIVYAQSRFLPSLVSSTVNTQLEFLAVGSWWILKNGNLQKIPSSREDVFADDELSRRDKIGLMKFIRHVVQDDTGRTEMQDDPLEGYLHSILASKFRISSDLQLPISALALSRQSVQDADAKVASLRVQRHMRSMGHFGPGFCAVLAKYAGNAEVAQVCCRACAVGGATYLLGQGVSDVAIDGETDVARVTLTNGITVHAKHLVGSADSLPTASINGINFNKAQSTQIYRSVTVVATALKHLFPPTSDNGAVPASTIIVVVDTQNAEDALKRPPVYLQIHSEDTGECPSGQCIIYASALNSDGADVSATQDRLQSAVQSVVQSPDVDSTSPDPILWSMSYVSHGALSAGIPTDMYLQDESDRILILPPRSQEIAFDDNVLDTVKAVWEKILGSKADGVEFLRFEDRSALADEQ